MRDAQLANNTQVLTVSRVGNDLIVELIDGQVITVSAYFSGSFLEELLLELGGGQVVDLSSEDFGDLVDGQVISSSLIEGEGLEGPSSSLVSDEVLSVSTQGVAAGAIAGAGGVIPAAGAGLAGLVIPLGVAGLGAAVVLSSSSADTTDAADTTAPGAPTVALDSDSGTSSTDGITNSGIINVSNLEAGATWEFSTDSGANFTAGTGTSFTLAEGTYAAGQVQVRQSDAAGNTSTGSNAAAIEIDTTVPGDNLSLTNTDVIFTFSPSATQPTLTTTSSSVDVATADLNSDGNLDFVMSGTTGTVAYLSDGAGGFEPGITISATGNGGVALLDMDGDGDLDAYVGGKNGENQVIINTLDESGNFNTVGTNPGVGIAEDTRGIATGDLDGDGFQDIIVMNSSSANEIYFGRADGLYDTSTNTLVSASSANRDAEIVDVNNDGILDIVLSNYISENEVFLGQGGRAFADATQLSAGASSASFDVLAKDIDFDGDIDLYFLNYNQDNSLLLNDGSGGFTLASTGVTDALLSNPGSAVLSLAEGDFNLDGVMDYITVSHGDAATNGKIQLGNTIDLNFGSGESEFDVSGITGTNGFEWSADGGSSFTAGTGTSFTLSTGTYLHTDVVVRSIDIAGNTGANTELGLALEVV